MAWALAPFFKNCRGRSSHVPYNPQPRQEDNPVVGKVNLPPIKSLPFRSRVAMMVIVPALAPCNKSQPQTASTFVVGRIAATPKLVSDRIHRKRHMVEKRRAAKQRHHHQLPSTRFEKRIGRRQPLSESKKCNSESNWSNVMISVKPDKLRILRKVWHPFDLRALILRTHNPTGMGPIEPLDPRWMNILLSIRITMMAPVMSRPPQRSFLS